VGESIGRWKSDLPRSLRQVVDEALDDVLAELGYEVA
jgi:hypothetical protein